MPLKLYRACSTVAPFLAATIGGEDVILHAGHVRALPEDDRQVLVWLQLQLIELVEPAEPEGAPDPVLEPAPDPAPVPASTKSKRN